MFAGVNSCEALRHTLSIPVSLLQNRFTGTDGAAVGLPKVGIVGMNVGTFVGAVGFAVVGVEGAELGDAVKFTTVVMVMVPWPTFAPFVFSQIVPFLSQ